MVPDGQNSSSHIPLVIGGVMAEGARSATRYVTPKFVVKATRHHHSSLRANARQTTLLVTFGQPNYAESKFIQNCLAAGEPFPVKKVQLRFYPTKPLTRAKRK